MSKVIELLKKALKEKKLNDSYALYNVKEYINQALALLKQPKCKTCICMDCGKIIKVAEQSNHLKECPKEKPYQEPAKKPKQHPSALGIIAGVAKARIEEKYGSVANAITEECSEPAKPPDDEFTRVVGIHLSGDKKDMPIAVRINIAETSLAKACKIIDEANKTLQDKPSHSDLDAAIFENNLLQAQLKSREAVIKRLQETLGTQGEECASRHEKICEQAEEIENYKERYIEAVNDMTQMKRDLKAALKD